MILSIETSTPVCSAALHGGAGELVAAFELHVEKSHSGLLTGLVESCLSFGGVDKAAIKAVAVSEGPGSYTGLRIGVSTAKGLCYALGVPLIAVSPLKGMARQVRQCFGAAFPEGGLLCPMTDARRMEVYCALYDGQLQAVEAVQAKIIDDESFRDYIKDGRQVFLFGDGAAKTKAHLTDERFVLVEGVRPSARQIGELAQEACRAERFVDVAYYEPFYLKDFVAKQPKKGRALV